MYWLGTESGPLGVFGFEGTCTVGDGSCNPPTKSMGTGFCNFSVMQCNTTTPLPYTLLQEQRIRESSKVDREEEGLSSNRPELVDLRECLEAHDDHMDLLYLTEKKTIVLKLQKRVEVGVTTLLIKVKDHRGDPLNEETDIRTELGRL